MDLSNFEKFKESENYVLYLQKDRVDKKQFEIVVAYKKYPTRMMRCLINDALFKLFFEPSEFAKVYLKTKEIQK